MIVTSTVDAKAYAVMKQHQVDFLLECARQEIEVTPEEEAQGVLPIYNADGQELVDPVKLGSLTVSEGRRSQSADVFVDRGDQNFVKFAVEGHVATMPNYRARPDDFLDYGGFAEPR